MAEDAVVGRIVKEVGPEYHRHHGNQYRILPETSCQHLPKHRHAGERVGQAGDSGCVLEQRREAVQRSAGHKRRQTSEEEKRHHQQRRAQRIFDQVLCRIFPQSGTGVFPQGRGHVGDMATVEDLRDALQAQVAIDEGSREIEIIAKAVAADRRVVQAQRIDRRDADQPQDGHRPEKKREWIAPNRPCRRPAAHLTEAFAVWSGSKR